MYVNDSCTPHLLCIMQHLLIRSATKTRMNVYARWACLVLRAASCPHDPRTLALWSQHVGVSESTLRTRCAASGVGVVATRDFGRLLRLVIRCQDHRSRWDPALYLEARDPRTIHRLLVRAGLATWPLGSRPPAVMHFLANQQLVHERAVAAVRNALTTVTHETRPR